ncbi:hypothetical protein [Halorhabdus amylolytica]|uniref:hypothetical protein n=1 Tax=Halorhabdus amylolytica TaxID=2559573 RepID=UPI0010AA528D|nr:hypothetical protein [Halorhabdus amylolytica]
MTTRTHLAGALLLATVLLAGCVGSGSTTPTATPSETVEGEVPGANALRADTLSAMENVSAYTADQNATIVQHLADGDLTSTIDVEYALNRTSRSLVSHRTVTRSGQRVTVERYVLDQTLYQRSDRFRAEYGSEWIERDVSESFARHWTLYDQLRLHQLFLDNASLSDLETVTLDGSEAYVLHAAFDTAELNSALRDTLDFPPGVEANATLRATFWIDPETTRPIKIRRTAELTRTIEGQSVDVDREITTRLTYENVSVSLPEGAADASIVGEE